ncbi:MAG: SxtJ family membrane protein [Desulfobacterales bacterium]|jgi:hypothetical protein
MAKEIRDIRIVFFIFCVLFALLAWKLYPSISSYLVMGLIAIPLLLIIISPLTLQPVFRVWMKIAHVIGKFNTQVLLTLAFVLVIIPAGCIMRLLRKDPMQRKFRMRESYWEAVDFEGIEDKTVYKRQF